MKEDTLLQHPKAVELAEGNRSLVPPIYQTVKFTIDRIEKLADPNPKKELFIYTRVSNPTTRELELQLARLQGTEDGICVGSGVAGLSMPLLSLLRSGDHVVLFYESYPPTRYLVNDLLGRFGVTSTMVSVTDPTAFENAITPKTKLIAFECPTNPMTFIVDIRKIVALAKSRGILTMLDNTFAGVLNHRDCGVDLFVHSLTKFVSGHGDVMGGAILGSKVLLKQIRHDTMEIGPVLDPHASYLISRGLKTYKVRRRQQCASALEVAKWLSKSGAVTRVLYPGLESHPGYALAKEQMSDSGAVLAFDLKSRKIADFFNSLKLFTLAASLGSAESLAAPIQAFYARDLSPEIQRKAGISEGSVRLSIGLEDPLDLIEDLAQALG